MLQNHVNVLYLTLIMALHYLMKIQTLIVHVLLLSCSWKKTQEFIPPGQIWIHFITAYGEYCKRRCTKQRYSKNGSLFPNAVYIVVSIGANSSVKVFNTLDDISSGPDGWFEVILLSSCTTLGTVTVIPAMA